MKLSPILVIGLAAMGIRFIIAAEDDKAGGQTPTPTPTPPPTPSPTLISQSPQGPRWHGRDVVRDYLTWQAASPKIRTQRPDTGPKGPTSFGVIKFSSHLRQDPEESIADYIGKLFGQPGSYPGDIFVFTSPDLQQFMVTDHRAVEGGPDLSSPWVYLASRNDRGPFT